MKIKSGCTKENKRVHKLEFRDGKYFKLCRPKNPIEQGDLIMINQPTTCNRCKKNYFMYVRQKHEIL